MKTLGIIFCLIIGSALAKAVSTIALDPEKESMRAVEFCFESDSFTHLITHDWPDPIEPNTDEWIWHDLTWNQNGYHWIPGVSGTGHDNVGHGYSTENVTMGTRSVGGTASIIEMIWGEDNSGTQTDMYYETNNGTVTVSGPNAVNIGPPTVSYADSHQYCNLEDQQHPPITTTRSGGEVYFLESVESHSGSKQKRETLWVLYTGGKSCITNSPRRSLWKITGGASAGGQPIPSSQVEILGKKLYPEVSGGSRWMTLPDGIEMDITPYVAGLDSYDYSMTPQKYPMTITATCSRFQTPVDLEKAKPEFCVGEQVTFAPGWKSGQPPWADTLQQWTLPDKYVNESWQRSFTVIEQGVPYEFHYGSKNYRTNIKLLENMPTSCWYVRKQGDTVFFRINMHFANGQYVSIARDGRFGILKPDVVRVEPQPPFGAAVIDGPPSGMLWLNGGPMNFGVYISETFPGKFGITQLVDFFGYTTVTVSGTFGQWFLDKGREFYEDETPVSPASWPSSAEWQYPSKIYDSPGQAAVPGWTGYNGAWKDYVRFTPIGAGSIPITLKRIEWKWKAKATMGLNFHMTITSDNVTPPTDYQDDAFPNWVNMYPSGD
jgi:hypothetical protein